MTSEYHKGAKASQSAKLKRMVGSQSSDMSEAPLDASAKKPMPGDSVKAYKAGGAVEGCASSSRLDRPARASGGRVAKGKTNVTVIVQPQGGQDKQPMPVPVPVPGGPPPMPPGAPMGGPPMPPPGAGGPPMMRKSGGRVAMSAGAGSGEGRLEKTERAKRKG